MKIDLQGIERPSGRTYSFEECLRVNRYLEHTVRDMQKVAEEIAAHENLTGTIYICNTMGPDRDSCTIGFEYPASKEIEEKLNRTFGAKGIREFAKNLPSPQREAYLQDARRHGWEGYL